MRFPRYSSESNSSRHFSIGIGVRSKQIVVGSKLRFRLEQIFGLIVDIDGKPVELPTQMAHLGVEGRIVRRDLEHTDVKAVVSRITELVGELRALRPDLDEQNSLRGVGVAIGGHINGKTGEVVSSPQMGWESPVPLAALLKETTGLKTVVVENDVNAVASCSAPRCTEGLRVPLGNSATFRSRKPGGHVSVVRMAASRPLPVAPQFSKQSGKRDDGTSRPSRRRLRSSATATRMLDMPSSKPGRRWGAASLDWSTCSIFG